MSNLALVPIDSVAPDPREFNAVPRDSIDLMKASITELCSASPIIVYRPTNIILSGSVIWQACKELGKTTIWVYFVDSPIEVKER